MRVVVLTSKVPFIRGGAELHADGLVAALVRAGHRAELVSIPFQWQPPARILDHMLACRLLDVSSSAGIESDLAIGLRFPAYLVPHRDKVLWVMHQYRTAYELWGRPEGDLINDPEGAQIKQAIATADALAFKEARHIYANSQTVAERLRVHCGVTAEPLYHPPPDAALYREGPSEPFLFFPSRVEYMKRQELVIRAMQYVRSPVRVLFAGTADNPDYGRSLERLAAELGVGAKVEWLGSISQAEKIDLFSRCRAVLYPVLNEDYGYVTLEAMLSGKPVITCHDSGGPLEFVRNEETGLVTDADPQALADAIETLWAQESRAQAMGHAGRAQYFARDISWDHVIARLLR